MKTNLRVLLIMLTTLFGCQKQISAPDNIYLETEIIEINQNTLQVRSWLNAASDKITEHGHCWSEKYDEPTIEFSAFSSLGPLNGVNEFKETLKLSINGILYIRAYIIKDDYIIYGKTETVQ